LDFGLLLIILFIVAPLLERLLKAGQQPPEQGGPQVPRRPGQPLPRQQPRRMPTADGEEELPFRSVPAGHERDEEAAAGMLPDDLWEILTGEKRPQPPREAPAEPPRPAPAPTAQVPPPLQREPDVAQRREIARLEQKRREEEERVAELRRGDQRRAERQHERDTMRNRPAAAPRDRTLPTVNVRDRNLRERPRSAGPPPGAADRYVRPVPVRTAPIVVSYDQNILGDEERHDQFHARLDRDAAAAAAARQPDPRVFDFDDPTKLRRAIVMAEVLGRPKGLD
jgi:hypothetical protein